MRRIRLGLLVLMAAMVFAALMALTGCGDDGHRRQVRYDRDRYPQSHVLWYSHPRDDRRELVLHEPPHKPAWRERRVESPPQKARRDLPRYEARHDADRGERRDDNHRDRRQGRHERDGDRRGDRDDDGGRHDQGRAPGDEDRPER